MQLDKGTEFVYNNGSMLKHCFVAQFDEKIGLSAQEINDQHYVICLDKGDMHLSSTALLVEAIKAGAVPWRIPYLARKQIYGKTNPMAMAVRRGTPDSSMCQFS